MSKKHLLQHPFMVMEVLAELLTEIKHKKKRLEVIIDVFFHQCANLALTHWCVHVEGALWQ